MARPQVVKLIPWKYDAINKGGDINDPESMGIIPRVMSRIFELIEQASDSIEFAIKVSMLEIYNERIQDLLNPLNNNLKIKESKLAGVYVDECTEIYVSSADEMRETMFLGSQNRTIASTRMNERSSRSHSIFVMTLSQKNSSTGTLKVSRIYFVDLAGSEKVAKTDVKGKQLEEAKNINKSLTALGMVINTLAEGKKGTHIPYRDSKLTRLLQDSLGGNSMTTLLIACSMCSYNDKETLTTLRFGQRAKAIKNKPKENVERSAKELQVLLEAAELKIKSYEELVKQYKSECIKRGVEIDLNQLSELENEFEDKQDDDIDASEAMITVAAKERHRDVDLLELTYDKESSIKPGQSEVKEEIQEKKTEVIQTILLSQESVKELEELRKKVNKQEKEITELNDMIEMIQAEIEDLTIENMDIKEKQNSLLKGGVRIISKYHNELMHANMSFEQSSLKIQKKWLQYSQNLGEMDRLKSWMSKLSEILETDSAAGSLKIKTETLQHESLAALKLGEQNKPTLLTDLLYNISQEVLSPFEKNPLNLTMNEFSTSFDADLMNLQSSIAKFKRSVLEGDTDSPIIDIVGKRDSKASFEMTAVDADKMMDKDVFEETDVPGQLKIYLDQAQANNEALRSQVKELQKIRDEVRSKTKAECEVQSVETIESYTKELILKEGQFEELKRICDDLKEENSQLGTQNLELINELDSVRKSSNQEISTPRGPKLKYSLGGTDTTSNSTTEEENEAIQRKVARYRKERVRAEQQARELRARLVMSDEHLQIESEKNAVLKRTIRDLEDEIASLSKSQPGMLHEGDHHFSKTFKSLRGGTKTDTELNFNQVNLFTCEDQIGNDEDYEEHQDYNQEKDDYNDYHFDDPKYPLA